MCRHVGTENMKLPAYVGDQQGFIVTHCKAPSIQIDAEDWIQRVAAVTAEDS